jgi:ubiquinone/menaquinone biosynthesis C-methylase UbiE
MMEEKSEKAHVHGGKSSRGTLNPAMIISTAGVKPGDVFLDAGCGDGYLSIAASQIVGSSGKVYAVDIDEHSISGLKREISERGLGNIEAMVADVTSNIPLADNTADVVLMANVLHGFVANGDTDSVMKEIVRVTKPGGKLAVVEFKKEDVRVGPPLKIKLSPEGVEKIASSYGFLGPIVSEVGQYHYQVMLTKR